MSAPVPRAFVRACVCRRIHGEQVIGAVQRGCLCPQVIPYKKSSKSKRMRAIFTFSEKFHPQIQSIKIKSKVLPRTVAADVMQKLRKTFPDQVTGIAVMSFVRDEIEKHYRDMGFSLSHVKHYNGIDSGKIEVVTNEPRVSRVTVQFVDDNFQEKTTPPSISKAAVLKHISMREGDFYALSDGRTALQEAFTLGVRPTGCSTMRSFAALLARWPSLRPICSVQHVCEHRRSRAQKMILLCGRRGLRSRSA